MQVRWSPHWAQQALEWQGRLPQCRPPRCRLRPTLEAYVSHHLVLTLGSNSLHCVLKSETHHMIRGRENVCKPGGLASETTGTEPGNQPVTTEILKMEGCSLANCYHLSSKPESLATLPRNSLNIHNHPNSNQVEKALVKYAKEAKGYAYHACTLCREER